MFLNVSFVELANNFTPGAFRAQMIRRDHLAAIGEMASKGEE
jgi:hypothetical protein